MYYYMIISSNDSINTILAKVKISWISIDAWKNCPLYMIGNREILPLLCMLTARAINNGLKKIEKKQICRKDFVFRHNDSFFIYLILPYNFNTLYSVKWVFTPHFRDVMMIFTNFEEILLSGWDTKLIFLSSFEVVLYIAYIPLKWLFNFIRPLFELLYKNNSPL
jgi:hypothetical protein